MLSVTILAAHPQPPEVDPLPPGLATLQPPRVPNPASSSLLTDVVIDGWLWPTRCSEGAESN